MKTSTKKKIHTCPINGKAIRISNPLYMQQKLQIKNMLRMAAHEESAKKAVQLMREQFEAHYPRFKDDPGQRMLLDRMFKAYTELEFRLYPLIEKVYSDDAPEKYFKALQMADKLEGSIRSGLVLMGIAFCSQKSVPAEQQINADPKRVSQIQTNIDRLRESLEAQLPEPPTEAEPLAASNSAGEV